jgi:hypothetical protein
MRLFGQHRIRARRYHVIEGLRRARGEGCRANSDSGAAVPPLAPARCSLFGASYSCSAKVEACGKACAVPSCDAVASPYVRESLAERGLSLTRTPCGLFEMRQPVMHGESRASRNCCLQLTTRNQQVGAMRPRASQPGSIISTCSFARAVADLTWCIDRAIAGYRWLIAARSGSHSVRNTLPQGAISG